MNILLVEDSNEKIAELRDLLRQAAIADSDVEVTYTVQDARKALISKNFDLLILDVLLPLRAGDPPKHSSSVNLLTELTERNTLRKPRHILGLTAFEEAIREAGPTFIKHTWSVVKYARDGNDWKEQIRNAVAYVRDCQPKARDEGYQADLCIITALATPEFDAITRVNWAWAPAEPVDDNTFVRRGKFESGANQHTVVAAFATRMGMVESALLTAKIIEREIPRFVMMSGICAGVRGKTNIGDILVADPTWDWQSGKHLVINDARTFAISPEPISVASFVRARFDQLKTDREFLSRVRADWPRPPDTELRIRIGPVASGSSVLADEEMVELIVQQNRQLLGVEMEAYGVAAAARSAAHPRPTPIVCKAVCDFADQVKDSDWQEYAAYCSARVVQEFFERYMKEITELAGSQ